MAELDPLRCLVGKIVSQAEALHDYIQLAVGDEIGLSIYNDFRLTVGRLDDLIGQTVTNVATTAEQAVIQFARTSLIVDLRNSAYRGPEAMQLDRIGHDLIVWN